MVYVSYKAKKGGDGSREKPFQNIEQAIEELTKKHHDATVIER